MNEPNYEEMTHAQLTKLASDKRIAARNIREDAAYAEGNAFHDEIARARRLEGEAMTIMAIATRKLNEQAVAA